MKKVLLLVIALAISCWAIPKPMESVENYNVVLVHGAYQADKGEPVRNSTLNEAYYTESFLGDANLGQYNSTNRITRWLAQRVFEEENYEKNVDKVRNSYVYHWRSFSNPANTSHNNAYEMADRTWNMAEKGVSEFVKRRALFEEAQEVKSSFYSVSKDDTLHGQEALDSIRQDPDLFRKLASRYVLVSHSMGGVASREYVQGNFYNGDVDKIITLDSPHEGTGALNMQIKNEARGDLIYDQMASTLATGVTTMGLTAVPLLLSFKATNLARRWPQGYSRLFCLLARWLRQMRCFRKLSRRLETIRRRSS